MRLLGTIFAVALSATAASGQEPEVVQQWFAIPEDQAALALYIEDAASEPVITVTDAKLNELDRVAWTPPEGAFVRQYRLEPGTYEVFIDGYPAPLTLDLEGGSLEYLKIPATPPRTDTTAAVGGEDEPPRSKVAELVSSYAQVGDSEQAQPKRLDPASNELYFSFEPPGTRPPPED